MYSTKLGTLEQGEYNILDTISHYSGNPRTVCMTTVASEVWSRNDKPTAYMRFIFKPVRYLSRETYTEYESAYSNVRETRPQPKCEGMYDTPAAL